MARTSTSRAMVLRPSTPTIRLAIPRMQGGTVKRKRTVHRRKGSGKHIDLTTAAIAGAAIGLLTKYVTSLPTIPGIGTQGTIGLIAYFLSKQGGQVGTIARTVCVVCVAGAAKNMVRGEAIAGEDEDFATV